MGLEAGYSYCTLDGYTFETNPLVYDDPNAESNDVDVKTLTSNITLAFDILPEDMFIYMEWGRISKTMKDILYAKYVASYTSYIFTDIYGNSHTVRIRRFVARRITSLDEDGFSCQMELKIVA